MKNSYRFFANKECQFYPCHRGLDEINCLFCYCPLYEMEHCPGTYTWKEKNGKQLKICTDCNWPHQAEHYSDIIRLLRERYQ